MKAVIFSHSEGNRLRPITCTTPKALLPIMGRTLTEHMIMHLHNHNINDITIMTGYLSDEIKNHLLLTDIKDLKLHFDTMQSLNSYFSEDDTLLISDSTLTDMDFGDFIDEFNKHRQVMIATKRDAAAYEQGSVRCDTTSRITSFIRCPDFAHPIGSAVMGIAAVPKSTNLCDITDIAVLLQKLTEKNIPAFAYNVTGYIKEITDFDSYKKCVRDFMDKKISLHIPCEEKAPSVWIAEDATVMQGTVIVPPVYIGKGSCISKGARIEGYSQIGENVNVGCFAGIKRSIIFDGCDIGENCSVRGGIIGKSAKIGFESAIYENSVVSDKTVIGKHCVLKTGVHIWPDKFIEDEVTVSENIVWGNSYSPTLFEDGCAEGIINREITPEFAISLARGVVTLLGKKIAVSCDGGGNGSMIKNALIAGIQSAGGKAYDMGEQPLPITRSGVAFYHLDGGIALSTRICDGNLCGALDIINSFGANIEDSQLKKLQFLSQSGQGERITGNAITEAEFLFEYKLYYLKQLINSTSQKALNSKLLIHCPSSWACELLKSAADDLNCDFTFTPSHSISEFIAAIKGGRYDFGAICDYKCETLTLIQSSGEVVSKFDYCALTALIIMKSFSKAELFVPQTAPESIEVLAKKYSATVYRTGISSPHLMNELSKNANKLHLHQFIYHFDAVGAIILLIDFLHEKNVTIDALIREIPPTHIVSTDVPCNTGERQKVVSHLCALHHIDAPEPEDAIKVDFENGWVLVIPKRTKSTINVIGYGYSKEYAREIADIITDDIAKS